MGKLDPMQAPSPAEWQTIGVTSGAALAYLAQHYLARSERLSGPAGADPVAAQARRIQAGRVIGGLALGGGMGLIGLFLPGGLGAHGLALPRAEPALIFWAVVVLLVLPAVAFSMHQPRAWAAYPPIRWARWDRARFLASAGTWALYLFGYELCFRGVLLFGLAHAFGAWPALAVMTALYVLVHLDKPASEALGTLPMGFVFGLSALESGSFVPAFVGHLVIAVVSDLSAIRANPALSFGEAP